jgi:hypothetical protein
VFYQRRWDGVELLLDKRPSGRQDGQAYSDPGALKRSSPKKWMPDSFETVETLLDALPHLSVDNSVAA